MTDTELQTIEVRAQAATAGPWKVIEVPHLGAKAFLEVDAIWPVTTVETMAFVAHARTDVPALVAEVRRLKKILQRFTPQPDFTEDLR